MVSLQHIAVWRELRSKRFALLLVTLAFCLVRARDQPSIDVTLGSTQASIVPADILLAVLALVALWAVARSSTALRIGLAPVAAAAFCLLILVTGAANGASAFVSGAKVVELAALALGVVVLLRTAGQFEAIVDVLILFTAAADVVGVFEFMRSGGRQASFLGEHDFAALATLPLLYGLARVLVGEPWPTHRLDHRPRRTGLHPRRGARKPRSGSTSVRPHWWQSRRSGSDSPSRGSPSSRPWSRSSPRAPS